MLHFNSSNVWYIPSGTLCICLLSVNKAGLFWGSEIHEMNVWISRHLVNDCIKFLWYYIVIPMHWFSEAILLELLTSEDRLPSLPSLCSSYGSVIMFVSYLYFLSSNFFGIKAILKKNMMCYLYAQKLFVNPC